MASGEITFYDTVTGKPLFVAPKGRSWAAFVKESKAHGWPSFRDEEVIQNSVRVLWHLKERSGGRVLVWPTRRCVLRCCPTAKL